MRAIETLQAGAFDPATLDTLARALEMAWEAVRRDGGDAELIRLRLASFILEQAEAGVRDETLLADFAVAKVRPLI